MPSRRPGAEPADDEAMIREGVASRSMLRTPQSWCRFQCVAGLEFVGGVPRRGLEVVRPEEHALVPVDRPSRHRVSPPPSNRGISVTETLVLEQQSQPPRWNIFDRPTNPMCSGQDFGKKSANRAGQPARFAPSVSQGLRAIQAGQSRGGLFGYLRLGFSIAQALENFSRLGECRCVRESRCSERSETFARSASLLRGWGIEVNNLSVNHNGDYAVGVPHRDVPAADHRLFGALLGLVRHPRDQRFETIFHLRVLALSAFSSCGRTNLPR